jgi:hypothetical protein
MWRLLGALELLDVAVKVELGDMLVQVLDKRTMQPARPAMVWALGRIGTRMPVYGPLNRGVPVDAASRWLGALMGVRVPDETDKLAVLQLARRTGDRYRDLDDRLRREVIDWLESHHAPTHFAELVATVGTLDREEQERVFGESLPKGLQIAR